MRVKVILTGTSTIGLSFTDTHQMLEHRSSEVTSSCLHWVVADHCFMESTWSPTFTLNCLLFKLPEDQIIKWHVWNTEKQIEQMKLKSKELVSASTSTWTTIVINAYNMHSLSAFRKNIAYTELCFCFFQFVLTTE